MKKIVALSLSALFLAGCTQGGIKLEEATTISTDFIKTVLAPGATLEIKSVEKESGLFKVTVGAMDQAGQPQEIISYMSPDGKMFFPQALNIAELNEKAAEMTKAQEDAAAVVAPTEGEAKTAEINEEATETSAE